MLNRLHIYLSLTLPFSLPLFIYAILSYPVIFSISLSLSLSHFLFPNRYSLISWLILRQRALSRLFPFQLKEDSLMT